MENAHLDSNGHAASIAPPSGKELKVENKLLLVLQLVWISVLIVPYALLGAFKKMFPRPGKTLKGQVVLVTGAGRGLGKGLAVAFAREGCKVAVVDLNRATAEQTAAEIREAGGVAKAYFTNVAHVEEVRALQEAVHKDLGPTDILVNNAALMYGGYPLDEIPQEDVSAVISVNLTSHFWMVKQFLPQMKARNSGHIVAIASMSAFTAVPNASAYVACKYGVRGLMDTLRAELESTAGNRVKTTTAYPYFINTSADYTDHWDLRIPAISIEEVVEAIIDGVKHEEVSLTIPRHGEIMLSIHRLLPRCIQDMYQQVIYATVKPSSQQVNDVRPTGAIIKDVLQRS